MQKSIKKDFQYHSVATIIIAMVLLSGFWIYYDYKVLQMESERLRSKYMAEYENLLRNEVGRIVKYIDYEKSMTAKPMRKSFRHILGKKLLSLVAIHRIVKCREPNRLVQGNM